MDQLYFKHYVVLDNASRIVDGWSSGPWQRNTTGAVCITESGGYQFSLLGEINPPLYDLTVDFPVPLYLWDGKMVQRRPEEDLEAERAAARISAQASEVRARRDRLLADTDWTQVLDAPVSDESRAALRVYRQALRDVTAQEGFPVAVVWPELPEIVSAAPDPVDEAFDVLTGKEEA